MGMIDKTVAMTVLGWIILITFIITIIVVAVERWKYKEFRMVANNMRVGMMSITIGFILGLLLAIIVALALSETDDSQATYFVNGVIVKGGTNWLLYAMVFFFGGGIIGFIIQFFTALPVLLLRFTSKEYHQNMRELRQAGALPKVYRKKAIAILLALVAGGISYWFYMKMWPIGCLHFFVLIVGAIFSSLGFQIVLSVAFFLMYVLTIVSMLIAVKKKEVTLKYCVINLD